jgi:hypothetical protein
MKSIVPRTWMSFVGARHALPIGYTLIRYVWTLLYIVLLTGLTPRPARASALIIEACTERQLDQALAATKDGDIVIFTCSGTIKITSIKAISKNIRIDAGGQTVTLDGQDAVPIFSIDKRAKVRINNLNVINGRATSGAGGITNRGTLNLTSSTIARNWHGLSNYGVLTVEYATFADNKGAGIFNSGTMLISASTFTGNIHGIDNASGRATVVNSTFAGNKIPIPNGMGAGIANSGLLTVINSTFVDNIATGAGGGIGTHKGGKVFLQNTIIANNTPTNCFGPMTDDGHNLQFPGVACGATIQTADPRVLPLSDYGGETRIVALWPDSPAIGAGDLAACRDALVGNVDQRGMRRVGGKDQACDIGALEFGFAPTIIWNLVP